MPRAQPGERFGGRTKGTPNKTSGAMRAALLASFEEVGASAYLTKIAREDPRTFCGLLGRLLPMEMTSDGGAPLSFTVVTGVPRPDPTASDRLLGDGGQS